MNLTTDDLIAQFRADVADPLRGPSDKPDVDSLWKVSEVNYYLNAAASKVARSTFSLSRTFDVPIVAARGPLFPLPTAYPVLDILRAYLNTARRVLEERNLDDEHAGRIDYGMMLYRDDSWATSTGTPRYFTREYKEGNLRLLPIPIADDTLTITAVVDAPTLSSGAALPFTNSDDIHLTLLWMKKLAYGKRDSDTFDPERSDKCAAEFASLSRDRRADVQRTRRAPGHVRFSW